MAKARLGAKKEAKKDVTKTQYCIDAVLVSEVLAQLPKKGLTIIGARVVVAVYETRKREPISNKMKRLGCTSVSKRSKDVTAHLTFDLTSPEIILRSVRLAAKEIGADLEKAYFSYLTLSSKDGTAGKFVRTKKSIPPSDNDLRKKITVLGLEDAQGDVKHLIKAVSAEAYSCRIQAVEANVVMCSKG